MSEEYFKLKCENGCEYKIPTHHTITTSTFVDCRYCDGKIIKKTKVTEEEVDFLDKTLSELDWVKKEINYFKTDGSTDRKENIIERLKEIVERLEKYEVK